MQKPTEALLIFAILPFTYYFFDYATGVYTELIYSGKKVVSEFLGFALAIAYLLFLLIYFKQYEEKRETEQRSHILEMQREQYKREIEAQKRSANALSLLRHDMRHFCVAISAYIDSGECDKAKEYISGIISYVDKTAMHKFCKNEIVNMILSSYENVMEENRIDFQPSIFIPEQLPISDVDLTSILSNALENAIHAVLPLEPEKRHIALHLRMDDGKLLISLKNTFAEKPVIIDGIPHSSKEGHGFGTITVWTILDADPNGTIDYTQDGVTITFRSPSGVPEIADTHPGICNFLSRAGCEQEISACIPTSSRCGNFCHAETICRRIFLFLANLSFSLNYLLDLSDCKGV